MQRHGLCILNNLSSNLQFRHLQSVQSSPSLTSSFFFVCLFILTSLMFVYLSVIFKRLDSNTREMPPNLFLGHKVVYSTF